MQAVRAPFLGVALVLAVALGSLVVRRMCESDPATTATREADAAAVQAVKDALTARHELDALMGELDELDRKIERAVMAIDWAENDVGRTAAKARLQQLLQEQQALKKRAADTNALASRGRRLKCVCVPRKCMDNPLAAGCF